MPPSREPWTCGDRVRDALIGAGWMQGWCHLLAAVILPIYYYGEVFKIDTCACQFFGHFALTVAACAVIRRVGAFCGDNCMQVVARRATSQYWHACLWAVFQHTDYSIIFMFRNFKSSGSPETASPVRAMENEVPTLNRLFLLPLGFTQDDASLTAEFGRILEEFAGVSGTSVLIANGSLIFWYQLYEGIIHIAITFGALVFLFRKCFRNDSKIPEFFVFWFYEMGMLLELVTYGPSYFWTISAMFLGAFFPSLYIKTALVIGPSVKALATLFCLHHHVGYCLDTWGTYQIMQAWCLTASGPREVVQAELGKKEA
eukprot:CAMPEP_0171081344 /NCGR_PEP_ID=MMETSP0766_2-20121228/16435_1 /TAXON_ID=439317 /ORGANISM="Gambierdiscus australes, Strain CAWD 149" /LENGTH=314 /DNA_ID=CAMNT_0011538639 /DNA_START=51 /DNA_END=995 /DNA_ORIENTATION=+